MNENLTQSMVWCEMSCLISYMFIKITSRNLTHMVLGVILILVSFWIRVGTVVGHVDRFEFPYCTMWFSWFFKLKISNPHYGLKNLRSYYECQLFKENYIPCKSFCVHIDLIAPTWVYLVDMGYLVPKDPNYSYVVI